MGVMYRVKAYQSDETESTIKFEEYEVLRETPKGYFIKFYTNYLNRKNKNERFVLKEAKNPFAFIDKKAALNNFYYRQKRHIELMLWKVEVCQKIRKAVKTMLDTDSLVTTKVNQYED